MKLKIGIYALSIICFSVFVSCSDEEETMSWKPGSSLHIVGASELEAGEDEEEYYVDGYTVKESYTWTLDGAPITPIRGGEFVVLAFDEAGTHVLTVSNGKLSGTMEITVE